MGSPGGLQIVWVILWLIRSRRALCTDHDSFRNLDRRALTLLSAGASTLSPAAWLCCRSYCDGYPGSQKSSLSGAGILSTSCFACHCSTYRRSRASSRRRQTEGKDSRETGRTGDSIQVSSVALALSPSFIYSPSSCKGSCRYGNGSNTPPTHS